MTRIDPVDRLRISRRAMVGGVLALVAGCSTIAGASRQRAFDAKLAAIHDRVGGRLGVCVLDTGSGAQLRFRAEDRFAMCSTFKLLLAAQIMSLLDAGRLDLERRIPYGKAELLPNSPVTSRDVATGALGIRDLCQAVITVSDNTAANLLLEKVGGPAGLTAFLRSSGDPITRLDRTETELNTNLPGDLRDTTTPAAMAGIVAKLLTGGLLSPPSSNALRLWLKLSSTGVRRLRAGVPATWDPGDKTGTGARGSVNDVMIATPPGRKPIVAACYMSESTLPTATLEAAHQEIGAVIAALA